MPLADRIYIGCALGRMLLEDNIISGWTGYMPKEFYSTHSAKDIIEWMLDSGVLEALPDTTQSWLAEVKPQVIELFKPAMRCLAAQWLSQDVDMILTTTEICTRLAMYHIHPTFMQAQTNEVMLVT